MKVVIDIPDDNYKRIRELAEVNGLSNNLMGYSLLAIAHGTVLPKGHGDLIDRSELIKVLETEIMYTEDTKRRATLNYVLCVLVFSVPTVIEGE